MCLLYGVSLSVVSLSVWNCIYVSFVRRLSVCSFSKCVVLCLCVFCTVSLSVVSLSVFCTVSLSVVSLSVLYCVYVSFARSLSVVSLSVLYCIYMFFALSLCL